MKRLCEALKEYADRGDYPCHMPGHKGCGKDRFLGDILKYDITEIDGFDDLHDPEGVIAESQRFAASLYDASETFFLVNGSTAGILSAVTATASEGDRILIARNCHRSVYNAAQEGRLRTSYLYPEYIGEYDMYAGIDPGAVEKAFREEPDIVSVVITSPTYEGVVSDIGAIADIVHANGAILIVDAAHGAHLGFSPKFPEPPLKGGADIVINSVHKTLCAPTQTALLHINTDTVDKETIRGRLRIYQSSSPSYLLMAGIDDCMSVLDEHGKRLLEELSDNINTFAGHIRTLKNISLIGSDELRERFGVFDMDPSKLLVRAQGRSGKWLYDELRSGYGIQPEMAAGSYCLLLMSIMDKKEGFDRIKNALICIDEKIGNELSSPEYEPLRENSGIYGIRNRKKEEIHEAVCRKGSFIDIQDAGGHVSLDHISVYPPGIPIAVPGEILNDDLIRALIQMKQMGMNLRGMTKDGKIKVYG